MEAKTIVSNGFDKNSKLEIIGLVTFNPRKLNKSAKKIRSAITMTLLKFKLISVLICLNECDLRIKNKAVIKTVNS